MPWDEENGFYPDNQILINYNGDYFKVYSYQDPLHAGSFSTINDLLIFLQEDLELFKKDYDSRHLNR